MALALVCIFILNRTDNEKFQRTFVCYFSRAFSLYIRICEGAATSTDYQRVPNRYSY
ncbi:hypothetical protein D3C80_1093710 [compost metagenome]